MAVSLQFCDGSRPLLIKLRTSNIQLSLNLKIQIFAPPTTTAYFRHVLITLVFSIPPFLFSDVLPNTCSRTLLIPSAVDFQSIGSSSLSFCTTLLVNLSLKSLFLEFPLPYPWFPFLCPFCLFLNPDLAQCSSMLTCHILPGNISESITSFRFFLLHNNKDEYIHCWKGSVLKWGGGSSMCLWQMPTTLHKWDGSCGDHRSPTFIYCLWIKVNQTKFASWSLGQRNEKRSLKWQLNFNAKSTEFI